MKSRWPALICLILICELIAPILNSGSVQGQTEPRSGGIFRLRSFADEFRMQLDPAQAGSFIFISEQIYDGLVRLNKSFNIVPSLAEYWEISQDGKKHKFYLRKGIKFHHGQELSADDVKFSLERLLDKKTNSPYYQFFLSRVLGAREFRDGDVQGVKGFRVIDKYTFEITWTKSFVSALDLMSMHFCKILPRDQILERGQGFFRRPSGTGPFMFDYWMRDGKLNVVGIRLKQNEDYFIGKPYLNVVEFCPLFNLDHFVNRQIDSIPILSERLLRSNYQIFQDGAIHPVFLGMSSQIAPLDKLTVRKAISYGLHRGEIIRAAHDIKYLRKEIDSYIPSRMPGFFPSDKKIAYDVDRARQLLQEAGFSEEREMPDLTLFLDLPREDIKISIFRELREQLRNLGIDLKLSFFRSLEEVKESKNPYLILTGRLLNLPDPEDVIRPLFFSKSIFNVIGYSNSELDRLLQEAELERSWTRRISLFHQIEQILFSDMPAIPLYNQENRVAMQPYVRGVEMSPLGFYYLDAKKIWLEK